MTASAASSLDRIVRNSRVCGECCWRQADYCYWQLLQIPSLIQNWIQNYFGLQYFAVKIWLGNHRIHWCHHWSSCRLQFSCRRVGRRLAGTEASLACGRAMSLTCCRGVPPRGQTPNCRQGCDWRSSALQTARVFQFVFLAGEPI